MNGEKLVSELKANSPLTINHIDGPYGEDEKLKTLILNRGL
jgi:hypothetical protein